MKKALKRVFSLLLSVCLLAGLVPAMPTMATNSADPASSEWEVVSPFDGAVTYQDGWTMNRSDNSAYSYRQGSKASFTFEGTGIRYVSQKDVNFGVVIVTLDGEATEIDANGPAQRDVVLFERTGLAAGQHTITVEAKDAGVFDRSGCVDITRFEVTRAVAEPEPEPEPEPSDGWEVVSPFDGEVTYQDGWTMNRGDNSAYSYRQGSKASFTFVGTAIRYVSQKDVNFGVVIVTLDGVATEINANGPAERDVVLFERTDLRAAEHTITIEAKDAGVFDRSGCVDITRFEVIRAEAEPEEEPLPGEWEDVSPFDGDVTYEDGWVMNRSDRSAYTSLQGSKAKLIFYGTGIRYVSQKDTNFGKVIITLDGEQTEVNAYGRMERDLVLFEKTDLKEGVHTITIEAKEAGKCVDITKFEVFYSPNKNIPADIVEVNKTSLKMFKGGMAQLKAVVWPYNAKNREVTWSSENTNIVTVDETGKVRAKANGTTKAVATSGAISATVDIEVKEPVRGEFRMVVDQDNPLFLHGLYRQGNQSLPGPLQGGKDIQGFWDSVLHGDPNGYKIPEDMIENQAIVIHVAGHADMTEANMKWVEDRCKETVKDQIPFFIMISNSFTSRFATVEWVEKLYNEYPNMRGVFCSENHSAGEGGVAPRVKLLSEQVELAAKYGGYVVYCDMNDNGDYMERILREEQVFNALKTFKDNFILLAKTTSAWSRVSYNSHESVVLGAWLSEIAGNWGSLIDSWMWQIEGYGPLWGKDTFGTFGGAEECRGPVTFPELLLEMRMAQQARVGATVYSFEHPDCIVSVGTENGKKNYFTPAFTEGVIKGMEYMRDYPIPTREEVVAKTKVAYSAAEGTLNDLAANINLLNPLYGDSNHNGKNGTTLMTYFTGRYGTVPSLPKLATDEDKAQFAHVLTKTSVLSELKNADGIRNYFDNLYPENYKGTGYAHFSNNTWLTYNSKFMIDSRQDSELDSTQNVAFHLDNNDLDVEIVFNPYTLLLVDDTAKGILNFRFNNYLVDKNPIWEGYNGSTRHWDSDNDTQMYDYLMDEYIPDEKTKDDRYRKATIVIRGLSEKPSLQMINELIGTDKIHQCKAPVVAFENGVCTITLEGNGWQEFKLNVKGGAEATPVIPDAPYENVALGKPVTGIAPNNQTSASSVTNGKHDSLTNSEYFEVGYGIAQNKDNPYYVQVALNGLYSVDKINLWRYYSDSRTYGDTVILVSADKKFENYKVVYNSDADNTLGFGAGEDSKYAESANGLTVNFDATNARYVRILNEGHNKYDKKGGHYVEIEAWGRLIEADPTKLEHNETVLNIPTFDAPGKVYGVTHPDVVKLDKPWNGYTYWMAVTPNQNGNSQFENPCLIASNDGIEWVVPEGIENPLTGVKEEPRPFHNCDTDLIYYEEEDAMYVYYVWSKDNPSYGQSGFKPSEVRLIKVTNDGTAYQVTAPEAVVTSTYRYDLLSPAIVKGPDGIYRMWSANTKDRGWDNQSNRIDYRTSEDGIHWSAPQSLETSFVQPGHQIWHVDVQYIASKGEYWAVFPAYVNGGGSNCTDLFFATSKDGINWTTYDTPLLERKSGTWYNKFIYRSCFIYEEETDMFRIWYSAGDSKGWNIAYTENKSKDMIAVLSGEY